MRTQTVPTSTSSITIPGQFTVGGLPISLNFTSPSLAVVAAIDANTPFPAGDLTLSNLTAHTSAGTSVQLGDPTKNVTFSLTAAGDYDVEVISKPSDVLAAINAEQDLAPSIDLATGTAAADRFLLMRLSYNLGGTIKGSAALGTGISLNFGATGSLNGDWDVIHRFNGEGARDVLAAAIDSWRLPRQIHAASQLPPGTWLITEVNGSIDLSVGVQAGYDYSWLKQLSGKLTGSIGVKVALAATASLEFTANGKYALMLARPDSTNKLRLALFKLAKNTWNFALNASVGVQGTLPDALKDPTDLIRAIFGTHATQLLSDLELVQKVAAGGSLTDQAANYLVQLGSTKIPGAADDIARFNAGVDAVNHFISQLGSLGQRSTSQLFAILQSQAPGAATVITDLTNVLTTIQSVSSDPTKIAGLVTTQLQKVAFFQTGFGQWLTAILQDQAILSPLAALKNNEALKMLGTAATTTLNILNGHDLQTLIDFVAQKLDLKNIPTLPHIDTWLKSKIAAFLNKALGSVVQQDLADVQKLVTKLFTQTNQFWQEAIAAAQKRYEATLVATYQSTTSDTALIDVVFDFDAVNPGLPALLDDAINGNFKRILIETIPGVSLNTAVLTHGIHRQTHVEFTMPLIDLGSTKTTDVVSSLTVKHDSGSRVLAYNVKGNNDVNSFVKGRSSRDGMMTLLLNFDLPQEVQMAPDFKASFGYSLRAAYRKTGTRQLINTLLPLVHAYDLPLPESDVENWAIDLDKTIEVSPTGHLGQSLISLDVAVDSSLPTIWLNAPANPKHNAYFILSKRIQERLRTLIAEVYFSQPDRYDDINTAYSLIIYSSLPGMNSFDINEDDIPLIVAQTKHDVYWNFPDERFLLALIFEPKTEQATLNSLSNVRQILMGIGDSNAQFFTPDDLGNAQVAAQAKNNSASQLPDILGSLIIFEQGFIASVIDAATKMAEFSAESSTDPVAALKALGDFSAAIVKTFNQGLVSSLFAGRELALLGSALFTEVTLALAEAVHIVAPPNASPSALFSITLPKHDAGLSLSDLAAGKYTPDQILVEQKLSSPLTGLINAGTIVS